ncbi:MAG: 2-amino-4-hydroxy-6-hydroxymethyldihydropteridine diphosphokinase [Acidimicrobiia bacterium]|nr:2-amino-4-hydroxy-6-hydroxymethyldihydropteridine diphosphokinase [Acidimicrobiia bacterium]
MARVTVAVALGSSLGDRTTHLAYAQERLARLLADYRVSSIIKTQPVGVVGEQTPFLNAAVVGTTALSARDLLTTLHAIEHERGRERTIRNAPRTLDLDLILYDDVIVNEPGLVVPHPRFRERRFVLDPLAEIAPELVDPVTGLTVAALHEKLMRAESGEARVGD